MKVLIKLPFMIFGNFKSGNNVLQRKFCATPSSGQKCKLSFGSCFPLLLFDAPSGGGIVKGKKCFRTCNKVSRSFSIHFWIHITSLKLDFSQFYLKKFPLTLITSLEKGKQVCTFSHLEKLYDMSSANFLKR